MDKIITYNSLLLVIYLANFLLAINLIFRERRTLDSVVAWILIMNTLPGLGLFIYFFFGRKIAKDNMFNLKSAEDRKLKQNISATHEFLQSNSNFEPNILNHKDMILSLSNLNSAPYTTNNSISTYVECNEFFNELLYQLSQAKKYINIEFYIFKDDEIGKKIIDILIDRLNNGVEVRLLFDTVGSRSFSQKSIKKLKDAGCKVANFFPSFLKIINFNLNYRNHRKIVVIDGYTGFVGGYNIGDEYLGKDKRFGNWRDTHIKIIGAAVNDLNLRFLMDWRYTTGEDINFARFITQDINPYEGNTGVQIISSGPDSTELDEIKYGYTKMIQNAKQYIYIQSPYLILDKTLLDTLKIASLSGVDVRIMIPSKPDHPFVYWASYSYAGELIKFGVKVYTYDKNSFLHAKTVVMDDSICSIGTANMDIRSFELNFEVNAFIYSSDIAKKQKLIFENDITNSLEITSEIYENRSKIIKFKESISRLLSPVL